jgi:hypothetical protein
MPRFSRYIGVDYSGAETPTASLPGLRVYSADADSSPSEVSPPPSPRKYWTRRGVAEWLSVELEQPVPTLAGIDHGFSFPIEYFRANALPFDWTDWTAFLEDFRRHWPTDQDHVYVDFVRDGLAGNGGARRGEPAWRRLTERRARSAKSVFHFDVQGAVAKSTHSGLPWLLYLRRRLGSRVHFWPFDGWSAPPGRSVIAEVYPALWNRSFPADGRNSHQHDAWCAAAWMRLADADGALERFLNPPISDADREIARIEGWILGVA